MYVYVSFCTYIQDKSVTIMYVCAQRYIHIQTCRIPDECVASRVPRLPRPRPVPPARRPPRQPVAGSPHLAGARLGNVGGRAASGFVTVRPAGPGRTVGSAREGVQPVAGFTQASLDGASNAWRSSRIVAMHRTFHNRRG